MSIAMNYSAPTSTSDAMRSGTALSVVAFGGALTGFSGVLVRISEIGPIATGAWRLMIAVLAFLPLLRLAGGSGSINLRGLPMLLAAGLFFALDIGSYNLSVGMTSVAHATLIVNLAPLVALAAGVFLFGEKFGIGKLTGLVAALGGAAMMSLLRADGGSTLAGNAIAMLAMIAYAFYLIAVKWARHEHGTFAIMFWSSMAAAIALFAAAMLCGEQIFPGTLAGWAVLIALGLIAQIFGQGLVAFGMREAPVGLASILLLTQPVVATIAAWAVLGETMAPVEAAGAALVLAGLAIASRARA